MATTMATTKRQALYTITLVEVTYAVDEWIEDVPAVEAMYQGYHLRARRGETGPRRLHIQGGRRETRTALLVDVPHGELAGARALVERSVWAANERDGGERYIVSERQRGRVMRETTNGRNRAA